MSSFASGPVTLMKRGSRGEGEIARVGSWSDQRSPRVSSSSYPGIWSPNFPRIESPCGGGLFHLSSLSIKRGDIIYSTAISFALSPPLPPSPPLPLMFSAPAGI